MGAALRKPVSADWESIYGEALRLESIFLKTQDISTKRIILSQWITLKNWGFILIEKNKYSPDEMLKKKEALIKIHNNLIKYSINTLYTIEENYQAPLLEN